MSRELFSQIIGPLNKGVNQQADSFVLPGFAKVLENGNCYLVEGLKTRLGSVPLKRIDTLTKNSGGNTLVGTIKWDEAWYFVYNRSTTERFILIIADDSRTVTRTGNTSNNSAVIQSVNSMSDLFVGSIVTGNGIPANTTIVDIDVSGSRLTLSNNATATANGVSLTIESNYTFATGVSNVEPISGILPTIVPVEQTFAGVTNTNLEYLRGSGRARDRFRATSFQDFVFVTNIQKNTTYDSTETLTRYNIGYISNTYVPIKAQIWVKLVDYNTKYAATIELDNGDTISANITTATLASGTAVSTQTIATDLKNALDTADTSNHLTFTVNDSQILIGLSSASRSFKSFVVADARGNTLMSGFSSQITSVVELPNTSYEGYQVIVAPDGAADQSSYYLKFNAENTTVTGTYG